MLLWSKCGLPWENRSVFVTGICAAIKLQSHGTFRYGGTIVQNIFIGILLELG